MASLLSTPKITVSRYPFDSPEARHLVTLLDADLAAMYPDWDELTTGDMEHEHNPRPPLEIESGRHTTAGSGDLNRLLERDVASGLVFFVAFTDSDIPQQKHAVACVALRIFGDLHPLPLELDQSQKYGELKRMYVEPSYRGRGISKLLISELERYASDDLELDALVIEVGVRQRPAVNLYEGAGYIRRNMYGPYVGAGVESGGPSICLEKKLA